MKWEQEEHDDLAAIAETLSERFYHDARRGSIVARSRRFFSSLIKRTQKPATTLTPVTDINEYRKQRMEKALE